MHQSLSFVSPIVVLFVCLFQHLLAQTDRLQGGQRMGAPICKLNIILAIQYCHIQSQTLDSGAIILLDFLTPLIWVRIAGRKPSNQGHRASQYVTATRSTTTVCFVVHIRSVVLQFCSFASKFSAVSFKPQCLPHSLRLWELVTHLYSPHGSLCPEFPRPIAFEQATLG